MSEELLHVSVVPCEDESDLAGRVLHFRQEKVEHARTARIRARCQLISFVDEQGSAAGILDVIQNLLTAIDTLVGKFRACSLLEVVPRKSANRSEEASVQARNGRLTCSAISKRALQGKRIDLLASAGVAEERDAEPLLL